MRVKEILEDVLKKRNIYVKIKEYEVLNIWDKVVGEYVSENAKPETIRNKILYVNVKNSLWMQELVFLKNGFINSINKYMGIEVVKDINFKIRELKKQENRKKGIPRRKINLKDADIIKIEMLVSSIKDKEIKEIIKEVMIKEAKAKILYEKS